MGRFRNTGIVNTGVMGNVQNSPAPDRRDNDDDVHEGVINTGVMHNVQNGSDDDTSSQRQD